MLLGEVMNSWEFLPNPGREDEGLGHAGIETFKGSPYPSIARECSQNSLDAAARLPDGSHSPVHLVFRFLSPTASLIPGLDKLRETLNICMAHAKSRKLDKDIKFFQRAIDIAKRSEIPVLSIEDFGTTGLVGPAIEGKPFHALVKSSGVSQKPDADAGGSFGIGKNAAFAISGLRTVFYSTLFKANNQAMHLAQGKSILVSHDTGNNPKRATGYWGKSSYMPVDDSSALPEWLRRKEIGTTVASIGFIEEREWHWQMVESLIRNFFSAIRNKSIRFTVYLSENEFVEINNTSLTELFKRQEVRDAAAEAGTSEDLEFSAAMLTALESSDAEVYENTFKDIGTFRLTLLQRNGFPRKLGILRNGMYISDNLRHFGHQMSRFPMSRDFTAILEPADKATSSLVRDMESPRHDEISAERIDDLVERKRRKEAMRKVGAWIRAEIKSSTTKPADSEILLDEMNRFFSKPSGEQSIPDPNSKDNNPELVVIIPKPTNPKPNVGTGDRGASGSSGGEKEKGPKGGRTTGERPGKGRGMTGGRGGKFIPYASLRNSIPVSGHGSLRRITLTPEADGRATLEVSAIGVSSEEAIAIRSLNGNQCGKAPMLNITAGQRISMEVCFDTPYFGPIRVVLSRIEEKANAS